MPIFSNRMYDQVKWLAQYGLPGVGALYFSLYEIWGLPYGPQIVGTVTAVDLFLGLLLGISAKSYNNSDAKYDGALVIDTADPKKDVYSIEVAMPIDEISSAESIRLKVQNPSG